MSKQIKLELELPTDAYRYVMFGWLFLLFAVIGFFIWACYAPLDKGVPSFGYVVSDTNRKEIKYLQGGIVEEIYIKEGSIVKEGQVLIKMNQISSQSTINAVKESQNALKVMNSSLQDAITYKKKELDLLTLQENNLSVLTELDYVPKSKLQDLQKEILQIKAQISENQGNVEKNIKQINELQERQKSYDFDLNNTLIKSPVDGVVIGLTAFTKGGSITPGTHLMDIVPNQDTLIIESQLPVNLIDKVHIDLDAHVLFTAFNQNRTPEIPATVIFVSADKYIDERTGNPYFKIRSKIKPQGQKLLQNLEVRLGMPAEVFVKTGERSLMSYLLKPFFDRSFSALKEE
jgi:protease secretion system membrane fusion protein